MKKIFFLLLITTDTLFAIGQKKLNLELSAQSNLSFSNDVRGSRIVGNNATQITYYKREKYQRPYFYFFCKASFAISKKINVGLQSGLQAHFYPKHYNGLERAFLAVPIQVTGDYTFSIFKKDALGVFIAAGGQFYEISY